jgi:multidrug efflux pump subunit AcrA (membrane-fusion protein)
MDSQRAYPRRSLPTAMLLAVALGACSNANTPAPAPQVPEVSVITVHRGSVPITTDLPGRTSAYLVAQVRARVDGIVLKREFKEGSEVKAGQRLYQIDPAPYIAALNSAQASLQKAEANLASTTAQAERSLPYTMAKTATRFICCSLLAHAFALVGYPILPVQMGVDPAGTADHGNLIPADFEGAPVFTVVSPIKLT